MYKKKIKRKNRVQRTQNQVNWVSKSMGYSEVRAGILFIIHVIFPGKKERRLTEASFPIQ